MTTHSGHSANGRRDLTPCGTIGINCKAERNNAEHTVLRATKIVVPSVFWFAIKNTALFPLFLTVHRRREKKDILCLASF